MEQITRFNGSRHETVGWLKPVADITIDFLWNKETDLASDFIPVAMKKLIGQSGLLHTVQVHCLGLSGGGGGEN